MKTLTKSSWRRFAVSNLLASLVVACSSGGNGGGGGQGSQTESCSTFDNFLSKTCLTCIHASCASQVESASSVCECTCTDGGANCTNSNSDACTTAVNAINTCFTQNCPTQCN